MIRHVRAGAFLLCSGGGAPLDAGPVFVGWQKREQATCTRCQVLVALADANGLTPWASKPSLRQALAVLLKKIEASP